MSNMDEDDSTAANKYLGGQGGGIGGGRKWTSSRMLKMEVTDGANVF